MNKLEKAAKQEKMYRLIEQWKQSGLSKQQFCKQHNIAYHVFYYYHNKYYGISRRKKRQKKQCQQQGFLPVKISPQQKSLPPVEITYPNGVSLKCYDLPGYDQIRELINIF